MLGSDISSPVLPPYMAKSSVVSCEATGTNRGMESMPPDRRTWLSRVHCSRASAGRWLRSLKSSFCSVGASALRRPTTSPCVASPVCSFSAESADMCATHSASASASGRLAPSTLMLRRRNPGLESTCLPRNWLPARPRQRFALSIHQRYGLLVAVRLGRPDPQGAHGLPPLRRLVSDRPPSEERRRIGAVNLPSAL